MASLNYTITRSGWDTWSADVKINYTVSYNASTNKSTVTFSSSTLDYWGQNGYGSSSETTITVQAGDNSSSKRTATLTTSGNTRMDGQTYSGTPSPASVTVQHSSGSGAKTIQILASTSIEGYFLSPSGQYTVTGDGSKSQTVTTVYTLTVTQGNGSFATVERTSSSLGAATGELPSGALIYSGDTLEYTFGALTGFDLTTHTVNGTTRESGYSHSISGNIAVKTAASVASFTLTKNAGSHSTITVNRTSSPLKGASTGTLASGATIYYNDVLKVSFSADSGYSIATHTVNGSTFTSGNTYTVIGNVTAAATATQSTFTLTINQGSHSTITVKRGSSTLSNGASITYGDVLTVTFGAADGYNVATHTVNGSTFTSGNNHTVTGAVTVKSTATLKTYTLSISAGTGSTATVKRGSTTLSNGATVTHGDVLTITFGASTGYTIATHTVNGSTFTSGDTHTVAGAVTVKATANVRGSTVSMAAGYFGQSNTITVTRHNSAWTHTVTTSCLGRTATLATKSSSLSLTWSPGLSVYGPLMTDAMSTNATLTCKTYNGDTLLATTTTTVSMSLRAADVAPTMTISLADGTTEIGGTRTLFEKYGAFVVGKSTYVVTATPTYKYGAEQKALSIQANGSTYNASPATTAAIKSTSYNTAKATVSDSRGQSVTVQTSNQSVLDYSAPSVSLNINRWDNTAGQEDESGNYVHIVATVRVTALNNLNSKTLVLKMKAAGGSWVTKETVTLNAYSGTVTRNYPADTDKTYQIKAELTDDFGTTTATANLSTAVVLLNFKSTGDGIGIGKVSETSNALEIASEWLLKIFGKISGNSSSQIEVDGHFVKRLPELVAGTSYRFMRVIDADGNGRGGIFVYRASSAGDSLQISHARTINGTTYNNALALYVSDTGERSVSVTIPEAWQKGLDMVYKAGDTMTFGQTSATGYTVWAGVIRSGNFIFEIPLDKPIASDATPTVTGSVLLLHSGGMLQMNNIHSDSNIALTVRKSPSGISVRGVWTSTPTGITANRPCSFQSYSLTVSFS